MKILIAIALAGMLSGCSFLMPALFFGGGVALEATTGVGCLAADWAGYSCEGEAE